MTHIPIWTIGYGGRSREEFIELLQRYEIKFLVDVRSRPYSRHNHQFSKEILEKYLVHHGIRYVFMGDLLGGRPADRTCYHDDGRVDYFKVSSKSFYLEGIHRLRTALERQFSVAVMCAEAKPQECHRSKLIGNTLVLDQGVDVIHIDGEGEKKAQREVMETLVLQREKKEKQDNDIFQLSFIDEEYKHQPVVLDYSSTSFTDIMSIEIIRYSSKKYLSTE